MSVVKWRNACLRDWSGLNSSHLLQHIESSSPMLPAAEPYPCCSCIGQATPTHSHCSLGLECSSYRYPQGSLFCCLQVSANHLVLSCSSPPILLSTILPLFSRVQTFQHTCHCTLSSSASWNASFIRWELLTDLSVLCTWCIAGTQ